MKVLQDWRLAYGLLKKRLEEQFWTIGGQNDWSWVLFVHGKCKCERTWMSCLFLIQTAVSYIIVCNTKSLNQSELDWTVKWQLLAWERVWDKRKTQNSTLYSFTPSSNPSWPSHQRVPGETCRLACQTRRHSLSAALLPICRIHTSHSVTAKSRWAPHAHHE